MLYHNEFPPLPSRAGPPPAQSCLKKASHEATKRLQPATSLHDLPDEILAQILDYLPGIDLQHFQLLTLVNLSLASRRLLRIVSDRLYAKYDSFFCTPYPFLRTLISNPAVASHVKSVSFKYGPNVHADRPAYAPSILDKQLIKDALKDSEIPGWKSWASDCNSTDVDQEHLYATILMYTPNVEHLDIGDGAQSETEDPLPDSEFPEWLMIVRQVVNGSFFGRVHRFEHLRSIRIDVQCLKLRHLAPIFRLRSMRKVTLTGLVELSHTKAKLGLLRRLLPANCSSVEELELPRNWIHLEALDILLTSFRQLKSFQYYKDMEMFAEHYDEVVDLRMDPVEPGDHNKQHWTRLIDSLEQHESSLETFSLEGFDTSHFWKLRTEQLRNFKKLAQLEVPLFMLTTYVKEKRPDVSSMMENSPPSLRFLKITPTTLKHLVPVLEYAALHYREHTPLLQKIKLMYKGTKLWTKADRDRLVQLFSDQGLPFEIERAYSDDDDRDEYTSPESESEEDYSDSDDNGDDD